MKSERYDSIEYSDEWESVPVVRAEPLTTQYGYDEDSDDYEEDYDTYSGQSNSYKMFTDVKPREKESNPQPVIKLQFLLAFLVLATAFILKSYGGELYTTVSNWYFENLNNSLVVTMKSQNDILPENEENTENIISATDIENQTNSQPIQENPSTQPSTDSVSTEPSTESSSETTTEAPSFEPTEISEADNEL